MFKKQKKKMIFYKRNFSKYFRINRLIAELVEKKDINSFINIITYINEMNKWEDIIKYIKLFTPYYKFRSSKIHELSAWLVLILKCLKKTKF